MSDLANVFMAATVMLLRDGAQGMEVFMVVRHHEIDAFSGALVFPGGKLDPGDRDPALVPYCRGGDELSIEQLSIRVAAVREAFEECGVFLARHAGSDALISRAELLELERSYRQALLDNQIGMADVCREAGLELALDLLFPYAHWITPKIRPKRFDTHFFLAPAPLDQLAQHDGSESLDSMWIRPLDAIKQAETGRLTVVFPTRMNLQRLGRVDSLDATLARTAQEPITRIQPLVERVDGGQIMTIPAGTVYSARRVFIPQDGRKFEVLE